MNKLRIAVAGAGQMGSSHVRVMAQIEQCELFALIDPQDSAALKAKNWRVPHYRDLSELWALPADQRPHGVVLATPNQLHVDQALACLAHGLPCLAEKPIATRVADAQRLVDAQAQSGVPVLIGHHRRHSSIMAKACEVVHSGRLGRIVAYNGSALFYKAENEGYFDPEWRRMPGGGPILLNMIHEVGNARSLCGEIVAVQALGSNAVRGFAVEDTAAVVLRFANGALGSFILSDTAACSHSWEHTSGEDPHYVLSHVNDQDCYIVAGTMGSLAVPTMRLSTYASAADRSWHKALQEETLSLQAIDPVQAQMAHFCDVIRGHAQALVSAQDGLQNLRVVEAISQAAQNGRLIEL
jgi:predicted dehydrogenase